MPPILPLGMQAPQEPMNNQSLLRPQQPQMSEDEIKAERKRMIDSWEISGKISAKKKGLYYKKYGITDKRAGYKSKKDVAGMERYTEGPEKGKRVFPGVEKPTAVEKPRIKPTAEKKYEADLNYDQAINAAIMSGFPIEWQGEDLKFGDVSIDDYWRLKSTLAAYGMEPVHKSYKEGDKEVTIEEIQPIDIKNLRGPAEALTPEDVVPPAASPTAPTAQAAPQLPEGVSMEDVEFTAEQHGITIEEVLERLRSGG